MWIQIYVLKLNMYEKTKVVFVVMWSWKRAEIVVTHGLQSPLSKAGLVSSFDAHKMFGVRILC